MIEASDDDRFPILGEDGARMLERLREHPSAPIFRDRSGHRLSAADLERVRAFESEVLSAGIHRGSAPPSWLAEHVARSYREVPHRRREGAAPARFEDIPTVARADLARDIAAHVPDDVRLDRLIQFSTTGTTGHPLRVPSDPVVAASYLAFHKRALGRVGVALRAGRGRVGVVLLGFQRRCFTYVSVTPSMDESGLAKINLHPDDWRDPADRARYLDAMAPEVVAGDPLSLAELLALPVSFRPAAVLSTAMALLPGMRAAVEARFGCPVVDLYSMNEAGPIAAFDPSVDGHVLLQHRLHVEILDRDGRAVPRGERGEVTLTGGFNPYLPLLRYRTGDHAALLGDLEPVLVQLEGRRPVRFRAADGTWRNNIDVSHALAGFEVAQLALHQAADGSLVLRVRGGSGSGSDGGSQDRHDAMRAALLDLFGAGARVAVEPMEPVAAESKHLQYTSDLVGAEP